jgi:hypothetical protein
VSRLGIREILALGVYRLGIREILAQGVSRLGIRAILAQGVSRLGIRAILARGIPPPGDQILASCAEMIACENKLCQQCEKRPAKGSVRYISK